MSFIKHLHPSRFVAALLLCAAATSLAVAARADDSMWRTATEKELAAIIPDRAPVEKERIETEFRTASGITDGRGHFVAGVVMITAGYSADGKYSHFFVTQVPLNMGDFKLPSGEYVFGYKRVDNDTLRVSFYRAATGDMIGALKAQVERKRGPIRSFYITQPDAAGQAFVQIGRFNFPFMPAS